MTTKESNPVPIYITKYALTQGILVAPAWISNDGKMAVVGRNFPQYFHGDEFHLNYPDALRQAEKQREKGIEAARKKVRKLADLSFPASAERLKSLS